MFENDYIMRLIKEMIRVLFSLIFRRQYAQDEEIGAQDEVTAGKLETLREMADRGRINEAENLLYEELDPEDKSGLELALAFYDYLNAMDAAYLEQCGFSRKEVSAGVVAVAKMYGFGGLAEAFLEERRD